MDNPLIPDPLQLQIPTTESGRVQAFREAVFTPSYSPTTPEKSPIQKLYDCITTGRRLLETKALKEPVLMWTKRVRAALFAMFGKDAAIVKDIQTFVNEVQSKGLSREQFIQKIAEVEALWKSLNQLGTRPLTCSISQTSAAPSTKDVFIIHGHDELNTHRLSTLLREQFGLNPIAMLAKPGKSRPLTDKFEDEAQTCSFAFALFTPDDEVTKLGKSYCQARPNVIYEVGWFIGRLGRERVNLILKKGTEIHSDLDGVSQIRFQDNIEEKFLEIQNELKAANVIL